MIAGALEIQLFAGLARLQADMREAKQLVGGAMQHVDRAVGGAKSALAALGLGISAAGLLRFAQQAIQAQDEMVKLSQKVGIGVGALSQLKYAAELSGASSQVLASGMKGLSQRMLEAGDGGSKAAGIFKAMGVDINGGTLPAIEKIADTFAELPDGTTKRNATEQADHAAATLLAGAGGEPFAPVPFVWPSDQYDKKIQVAGRLAGADETRLLDGSLEERRFVMLFGSKGRVCGAVGLGRPRLVMKARALIRERAPFASAAL